MSQYRAKSQLYQVFVTCRSLKVQCDEIHIPKLNISLEYKIDKGYISMRWGALTLDQIYSNIRNFKEKGLKPIFFELNHIKIENELIELINSKDELNRKLGSEILIQKFDNIKIEHTK